MPVADRAIWWEGFYNARDLGGRPTISGAATRYGVLIRSADLRFVTAVGWQSAVDAGFRTVLDLRNDDEAEPGSIPNSARRWDLRGPRGGDGYQAARGAALAADTTPRHP